jgi:hypothetical protein
MTEKEVVDRFLSDVFAPVLSDLRQMTSHPQGLDFGIIMLVCSGIELIGALDYGGLGNSGRRFQEALANYFPSRYSDYKETLYNCFRCGLAHQAFIKPGTATARNPEFRRYHLWGVLAEGERDKLLFIHPDVFVEDFFAAIKKFRDSFDADPEKVGRAYRAIRKIYRDCRHSSEPVELYLSLPDDGLEITRQPLPKWVRRSEVLMGSIAFEDKDING